MQTVFSANRIQVNVGHGTLCACVASQINIIGSI